MIDWCIPTSYDTHVWNNWGDISARSLLRRSVYEGVVNVGRKLTADIEVYTTPHLMD